MKRGFLLTVLVLAIGVAALWPTVLSLVGYWEDTDNLSYTHGYVVAAICLWLLWRGRARLNDAPLRPSWPAVVVTAVLGGVWYLGWISGLQVAHQLLLPAILLTAVAGALGLVAARAAAFAIGYLYFAIPVWDSFNHYLQALTTLGVTLLIRISGLPAFIEGNFVHIPAGTFEIAGGCSGLHFFIVALAIAVLYGEIDRESLRNRLLLALIAVAMAIVMNWVRVFTIIVNGHLTDMQGYLVQVDHYKFGWVLFAVLLVLYFWIVRRFVPLSAAPGRATAVVEPAGGRALAAGVIAAVSALAVGPLLVTSANARSASARAPESIALPGGEAGWRGPEFSSGPWQPKFPGADVSAMGEYRHGDRWVVAYVNVYATQSQDRELVGYHNDVLGARGWQVRARATRNAGGGAAQSPYEEVVAAVPGDDGWVVGYLYVVDDRTFASGLASKLYYGRAVLAGRPQSGMVAAAARCPEDDCASAATAVNAFLSANADALADIVRKGP